MEARDKPIRHIVCGPFVTGEQQFRDGNSHLRVICVHAGSCAAMPWMLNVDKLVNTVNALVFDVLVASTKGVTNCGFEKH